VSSFWWRAGVYHSQVSRALTAAGAEVAGFWWLRGCDFIKCSQILCVVIVIKVVPQEAINHVVAHVFFSFSLASIRFHVCMVLGA
jgi:hypothetical protein